jgi:hypothetical protein
MQTNLFKKLRNVFTFLLTAFLFVLGHQAFAQGPTGLSDKKKDFTKHCQTCTDAWVSKAYYQVWGSCANGGGNSGDCNISNYGGGRWSSYDDLLNKVKQRFTGSRQTGKIYIFMRPVDALGFGHVGWGIMLSDGSYYCGATENPFNMKSPGSSVAINPGGDINSWTMRFATEGEMFGRMKSLSYSKWKGLAVSNPNIANAKNLIDGIKNRGYGAIGNNCFDHAYDVFTYYGVHWTKLPLKQTYPVPNEWFRQFYADNSNNYAEGWGL